MDRPNAGRRRSVTLIFLVAGLVLLALGTAAPHFLPERPAHAIILTFDGTRADAFSRILSQMPAVAELARNGAAGEGTRTLYARTPEGHATIFSGASPQAFGFAVPPEGLKVQTLFDVAAKAGRPTLFVDSKAGRLKGLERGATKVLASTDYATLPQPRGSLPPLEAFWGEFEKTHPVLGFCLLPLPDRNGHTYGHTSKEYEDAIVGAGEGVSWLVGRLQAAGLGEKTLVVITADHGMTGTDHSGSDDTNFLVPLVISGPGIRPGSTIEGATTADIAPTVAALTGLPRPRGATGHVLTEAFTPRSRLAWKLWQAAPILDTLAALMLAAAATTTWLSGRRGRAVPREPLR